MVITVLNAMNTLDSPFIAFTSIAQKLLLLKIGDNMISFSLGVITFLLLRIIWILTEIRDKK